MKANKMVVCRKAFRRLAAGLVVAVGLSSQAAVEPPSFIAERALLWLDAMDETTLTKDGDGKVSAWTSKVGQVVATTAKADHPPLYEADAFGIPTVDFGETGSTRDMTFATIRSIRMAFFVVKIEKNTDAFWLGGGSYHFHRGNNGIYGNSSHAKFSRVWDLGEEVAWKTDVVPDDSFRVVCIETSQDCNTASLTCDRNKDERSGGRQLSELILFNAVLTDAEREQVTSYLMRKWGMAVPGLTVKGAPSNVGNPEPGYGLKTDLVQGETYLFTCPAAVTNDSGTLCRECAGWELLMADGTLSSGTETSKSIVYDETMEYATLTWKWSDQKKLNPARDYMLPDKFVELVYLEQDTGAYVDTGVKLATNTTEIVATIGASAEADYSNDQKWVGVFPDSNKSAFGIGRISNAWRLGTADSWYGFGGFANSRGPLTIVIADGKFKYLDESSEIVAEVEYKTITDKPSTGGVAIFACINQSGGVDGNTPSQKGVRIYGVAIYENHVCVNKFVPCYRKKDKALGFYDVMTDIFHEQKGLPKTPAGSLLAGPRVYPAPGLVIFFH